MGKNDEEETIEMEEERMTRKDFDAELHSSTRVGFAALIEDESEEDGVDIPNELEDDVASEDSTLQPIAAESEQKEHDSNNVQLAGEDSGSESEESKRETGLENLNPEEVEGFFSKFYA